MTNKKIPAPSPSLKQILWTDYASFINAVLLVMLWAVYIAWVPAWRASGPIMSPAVAPYYLGFCLLVSAISLSMLIYRVLLLRRIFIQGDQVRGRITKIDIRRDRGKVEYVFIYKGEQRRASAGIHRTKQTLALKNNTWVTLMVDPSNPAKAFIRDIYIEE